MACPWVMHGGDRLQIWMVAADIINKQLQIDGHQLGGFAERLTAPHHKRKLTCCE
jgi:hypothetical protein